MTTDIMEYDIIIIGAGASGISCAIKLKQLCIANNCDLSIAIIEKGSNVGAHILSGCVIDITSLQELLPNYKELNLPINVKVCKEDLLYMSQHNSIKLPIPKQWQNNDNYIISLSQLCRSLAEYAETLGIEIYPGFSAVSPIIENNQLVGVVTGAFGVDKNGKETNNYQAGIEIRAKQTILAEGCRGSLTKQIIKRFKLDINNPPQTYGLGIKEVWRINPSLHQKGYVLHSIGYPLNNNAYGGGFMYHMDNNLISIGLVTSLDYKNPDLSPYDEFQKFKQHPQIIKYLKEAERIEYGARTVTEGGLQSLPKLSFSGGIIIGDGAGFLNVPKIKGVNNAIKSGIIGAISIFDTIKASKIEATNYESLFKSSWLYQDLYKVRNIRPSFRFGIYFGLIYSAVDYYIFNGNAPWTFKIRTSDHARTKPYKNCRPIHYNQKYDGIITFDKTSSLHLANINHNHDQPCHLKLNDNLNIPIKINLNKYNAPETKYCPAQVYEFIKDINHNEKLQINSQNCVHCKACDIKDPTQNITWNPPESGSGPQYSEM